MKKKLLMLAYPYSHPDPEVKKQRIVDAAKLVVKLMKAGYYVFQPSPYALSIISNSGEDLPDTLEFWESYCTAAVSSCSVLLVADVAGWETSKGIAKEIHEAHVQDKKVYLISTNLLEEIVENETTYSLKIIKEL